jgi:hypothetical protein
VEKKAAASKATTGTDVPTPANPAE